MAMHVFFKDPIKIDKKYSKIIIRKLILFYLLILIISAVVIILTTSVMTLINGGDLKSTFNYFIHNESKGWIATAAIGMLSGLIIFMYFEWQEVLKRERKLREENLIFQYETLKNQVNPHFLFNSLNTLSSLIHEKPDVAEAFISKLSSIYRYVLENKDAGLIDLPGELSFASDYFYLQKIRDEEKISLEINIPEDKKYRILPISIQILIENALKHNTATREKPLNIMIEKGPNDMIIVRHNLQKKLNIGYSPKTGLKNLEARISLATKKEMQVIETESEFIVKIPLIPDRYESADH
jgi:LytS/YehU family sensor histidine kinase